MQLKDIKKEGIFTTLYYELTWKIGWEQLLSILDVVIRTDFQEKGFQSLAVGMIAGTSPQDVTRDVLANGGDIRRSAFAKGESGYAVLTGYSHLMKVTMRIIVWNQSDRFILQLADDRAIDKDGKHSLYYELTWKIGWEQLLSILDVVIRTDFQEKGFQSLAVGMIAGTSPQDVTRDVLANGGDIRRSAFAKGESGYAVLTGYSHLMKVTMRIIVWNQSDRFILQLADDRAIDKDGKHSYDKYADSIEILAHIDYAKKQPAAVF